MVISHYGKRITEVSKNGLLKAEKV